MRKNQKNIILLILLIAIVLLIRSLGFDEHITFENLKRNRDGLKEFVKNHYILSVSGFIVIYIFTAFFLPGAIVLTIAGGLLFGVFWGTIYVCIGAATGATLAFFTARHLIGEWIQDKYQNQLKNFNEEIAKNGYYYLLALRVIPIFPFSAVNYFAGVTKITFKIFLWTLLVTVIPGTIVYAFAGQQLGTIESVRDIYSAKILILFLLLVLLVFSPMIFKYAKRKRRGG